MTFLLEKEPLLSQNASAKETRRQQSNLSTFSIFRCFPIFPSNNAIDLDSYNDSMEGLENEYSSEGESDSDEELPILPKCNEKLTIRSLSGSERLLSIRKIMKEYGVGVYIVPSEDEHQSEYTAQADKRREYMSGFTGSAGICVITLDDGAALTGEAALSTDGRYFLQAEKELDSKNWRLLKQGAAGYPSWQEFAFTKAKENSFSNVVSCDPKFMSLLTGEFFASALSIRGFKFMPIASENFVDTVWGSEKPTRSCDPVYELPLEYSGESAIQKVGRVRQYLQDHNASHIIVTALDDIGWLLNLRADTDIPFSPFFFAYIVLSMDSIVLYAERKKIEGVTSYLFTIPGLSVKPYQSFYKDLGYLKASIENTDIKVIFPDKAACNYALIDALPRSIARETILYESVISVMKLTKNRTELLNAKVAQTKDSLVFILLASWLENMLLCKKKRLTEYQVAQKIYQIRQTLPNFKGLSYETIASTGPNAAVIHYEPSAEKSSVIDISTPFLLDSGAHFLEGTTDITRTYKFGNSGPMAQYRKFYSLVLKGHLSVAMAKFPEGSNTTGTVLDSYARQPLWNEGLDFNHGTGHGVGSFGNVHEGPLYILTTSGGVSTKDYFKKGAILTDEPGYYVDGKYGFRVESELEIVECKNLFGKTRNGKNYLGFDYLTKVPFCSNLIDTAFFTKAEKKWINDYHSSIRAEFGLRLLKMGQKRAYRWLVKETKPI